MTKLVEAKPSVEIDSKKEYKIEQEDKIRKIAEEEKRLVKGRFRNYETPGTAAYIYVKKFHEKYAKPFEQTLLDNEMYEIPLYVARFLNGVDVTAKEANCKINTCAKLIHGFQQASSGDFPLSKTDGIPVPIITGKYSRRYGFESLEFDIGL